MVNYEYDSCNRLVRETVSGDTSEELLVVYEYSYNKLGQKVKAVETSQEGVVRSVYSYDDLNRQIQKSSR